MTRSSRTYRLHCFFLSGSLITRVVLTDGEHAYSFHAVRWKLAAITRYIKLTKFSDFALAEPIQKRVAEGGYTTPSPIQQQAIPPALEGKDILGIAQTGTGKTAAFSLPAIHHLLNDKRRAGRFECRMLVLAPTRELARQIADSMTGYSKGLGLFVTSAFGGVPINRQKRILERGVDVLVATPGRLLDLIKQKHLRLDLVETFVIDEADRMFDMGFIRDVRKIVSYLPRNRQSMLFSATMPADVMHLVGEMLHDPLRVNVSPKEMTVARIDQQVHFVATQDKRMLLLQLLCDEALKRVIVFSRTKHGADKITKYLGKAGHAADTIHGGKSQNTRQKALEGFRNGESRILVATDVAARGIDIDDITHVINFELPHEAENYVHRIGRTARAGGGGTAIAFCDPSERSLLRGIERLVKQPLTVAGGEDKMPENKKKPGPTQGRPNARVPDYKRARNRRKTKRAA
jgi:ATP-dependent RNA helicase RhlE